MRLRHFLFALTALTSGLVLAGDQPVTLLDMESIVPADWVAQDPSSGMRLAQFRVPSGDGAAAELVVYYFGPGQGGSLDANVERWASQFSGPDGPVEPQITELDAVFPTTLVELTGSYARGVGMGPAGDAQPDRTLLAALVETPQGTLFPQLHGPADLVAAQRDGFVSFVEGIRASEEPSP
jgi:hypothetical protein